MKIKEFHLLPLLGSTPDGFVPYSVDCTDIVMCQAHCIESILQQTWNLEPVFKSEAS